MVRLHHADRLLMPNCRRGRCFCFENFYHRARIPPATSLVRQKRYRLTGHASHSMASRPTAMFNWAAAVK